VLGLIEVGERGIELLERSAECLSATQASLEHAYALADLGAALRRAGRRVDSRGPLQHALELANRLDAVALARRTREELAATGARPRRELLSGVASLTPSERRIARLAAEGHTNPQIAQALFVTPKTVEFHLRHVYQKLDISGRGKLITALAPDPSDGPSVRV
jgi:DNA-binding CsgD family transcriptional regulator